MPRRSALADGRSTRSTSSRTWWRSSSRSSPQRCPSRARQRVRARPGGSLVSTATDERACGRVHWRRQGRDQPHCQGAVAARRRRAIYFTASPRRDSWQSRSAAATCEPRSCARRAKAARRAGGYTCAHVTRAARVADPLSRARCAQQACDAEARAGRGARPHSSHGVDGRSCRRCGARFLPSRWAVGTMSDASGAQVPSTSARTPSGGA